jgi:hypothetical protein
MLEQAFVHRAELGGGTTDPVRQVERSSSMPWAYADPVA